MTTVTEKQRRWGYREAVVPAAFARKVLTECKREVLAKQSLNYTAQDVGNEHGWRHALAEQMCEFTHTTRDANYRRLYDITHFRTQIVYARLVEAMQLACGLDTTDTPTLPGSDRLAREMTSIYHEIHNETPIDHAAFTDELTTFSIAALSHSYSEGDELVVPDEITLGINNLEFLEQIKELTAWPATRQSPLRT